jgi:hypothetical protein
MWCGRDIVQLLDFSTYRLTDQQIYSQIKASVIITDAVYVRIIGIMVITKRRKGWWIK